MLSDDEIAQQQELLQTHRQTLAHYLKQQARLGEDYTPPGVSSGITHARANIQRTKQLLRDGGVNVVDHPDDAAPLDDLVAQSPTKQRFLRRRRWMAIGVTGGVAVVLAVLVAGRFFTEQPTSSRSFIYSFSNGTSDWRFAKEADADKWQVVPVAPGEFVYQGTAPNDYEHEITTSPPNSDVISEWQNYAVNMKVRVVHSGGQDHAFNVMMRGTDNADSGCWGYLFVFDTSQGQAEIKLNGLPGQCAPTTLARGSVPIGGDQWFTIRMEAVGDRLRLFVENEEVLQAQNDVLSKGYFDVNVVPGATVQFDDIHISEIIQ